MKNEIMFLNCMELVSSDSELTEAERNEIIKRTGVFLSHVSARRYVDLDEEFFLYGSIEENPLFFASMEEEEYLLYNSLVNAYRKECVNMFGEGILPHPEYYDEAGVTEERMTENPYSYPGYRTHIFLRSITTKQFREICSAIARDEDLMNRITELSDPDSAEEEKEPADLVRSFMDTMEHRFVYSLPGMRLGDEAPLSLAIQVQHAVFCRMLAENGGMVPIHAFLSDEEIKSLQ